MSVLTDDHWHQHPAWGEIKTRPAVFAQAFLLHWSARSWSSYFRRDGEPIPAGQWRRLDGWTRTAESALADAGIVSIADDGVRLLLDGSPGVAEARAVVSETRQSTSSAYAERARKGGLAKAAKQAAKQTQAEPKQELSSVQADAKQTVSSPPSQTLPLVSSSISSSNKVFAREEPCLEAAYEPAYESACEAEGEALAQAELEASAKQDPSTAWIRVAKTYAAAYERKRSHGSTRVTFDAYHRHFNAFDSIAKQARREPDPEAAVSRAVANFFAEDSERVVREDYPPAWLANGFNKYLHPPKASSERARLLKHGMALPGDFSHVKPMPPPDEEEKKLLREWGVAI